jgi:hypothetical protein
MSLIVYVRFSMCAGSSYKPAYARGDILVEIMASPANYRTTLGHAFVSVDHLLNIGVKEDCYGFYPARNRMRYLSVGATLPTNSNKIPPSRQHHLVF